MAAVLRSAAVIVLTVVLASCGDAGQPAMTGPEPSAPPDLLGDPVAGRVAFIRECAQCHASRDGYDLAAFGFSHFDVVRRGLGHVDSATSRDIAAHIATFKLSQTFRQVSPFQPAARIGQGDRQFWTDALGTSAWPAGLTADALRTIDPRDLPVPLSMPEWSLEGSNEDWMPDVPLTPEVLDYSGGAIRNALDAYYANPTEAKLLRVLEPFKAATEGAGLTCWAADPDPCFDARRWMASLAAQHYLRLGPPAEVPVEVARTWWDVGVSAIDLQAAATSNGEYEGFDRVIASTFRTGARWMYLAYSYQPEAFNEPGEYMGTFLQAQELYRVAAFVALRRMVGDGLAHQEHADQFLQDGYLAVKRADDEVGPGLTEFVFEYYVERLEAGRPAGLDLTQARALVKATWDEGRPWLPQSSPSRARVQALRDRVLTLLQ